MSHELTPQEAREEFLKYIWGLVEYWGSTDPKTLPQPKTARERLEGLAFSILVTIDGEAVEIPACDLKPRVPVEDREYLASKGKLWYPSDTDIGEGELHNSFHKVGRENGFIPKERS